MLLGPLHWRICKLPCFWNYNITITLKDHIHSTIYLPSFSLLVILSYWDLFLLQLYKVRIDIFLYKNYHSWIYWSSFFIQHNKASLLPIRIMFNLYKIKKYHQFNYLRFIFIVSMNCYNNCKLIKTLLERHTILLFESNYNKEGYFAQMSLIIKECYIWY